MSKRILSGDKHIGARIRARRLLAGKTQEWLADKLSLTFQQVQKYEKGANRVSGARLQQIANLLNVPVEWFFEGLGGAGGKAPADNLLETFFGLPHAADLARNYLALGTAERRAVEDVAMALAGKARSMAA